MQELVNKDQSRTANDEDGVDNEQHHSVFTHSSRETVQMGEPVGLASDSHRRTTHNNMFVPMSMSNASMCDALPGGEETGACESQQQTHDTNFDGISSSGAERMSSRVRPSTSIGCKMRGRHSNRSALADDKSKRSRTTFNAAQINALEKIFEEQQYPDQPLREKIAERLEMEEQKVVIWFQNRRAKYKRHNRPNNVNVDGNAYSMPMVQGINRQSVIGATFKRDSRHVNANDTYGAVQQTTFQHGGLHHPYNFDKPSHMMHGPTAGVGSTSQEHCRDVYSDANRGGYELTMDGFASSPEPVTSSVDVVEDVASSLKQDKPIIQEAPPNQVCTDAGCQDEMRQALLQWQARQNMSSHQPQHSPIYDSFPSNVSNSLAGNVAPDNTSAVQINRQPQTIDSVYDETYVSSTSSSSCSENEDENYPINHERQQLTTKNRLTEHHQVPSSVHEVRSFSKAHALIQQNQLYLDIPSVSSGDVSSPAPHSTTSTASWPSTSDLSSIDTGSPAHVPSTQFEQMPLSEISRFNIPTPAVANWSNSCNEAPIKQTYLPHMTNPYLDLPPLRRHDELPMQRCRRRLKMRRMRHEERRRYPNNKSGYNVDQNLSYAHNTEMNVRRQEQWDSMEQSAREGMVHGGKRGAFTPDDFASCQNNIRPQCNYGQPVSTYHTDQEQDKRYQRNSKRRHHYNRLQYPVNPEYSHLTNQNMMGTTTEELRSAARQQHTDRNGNISGFRFSGLSSSGNAPKDVIKQNSLMFNHYGSNASHQQTSGFAYQHPTPEWNNNPVMEVQVPIPHRRPKHSQPHRADNSATSGVVHHYGDADELSIPPLPVVESDLSQSLNADQSATLNRVLESVVKDIFPFSDNFISI